MDTLKVIYRPLAALKVRENNPRKHSKKQIRQLADSIERFGFTNPVLLDGEGRIIAGHGRVEAAKRLELDTIPTIRIGDMTEAEIRAYVIADNRVAELAGWDRQLLAIELEGLLEMEPDFDITITGFDAAEIDLLIDEISNDSDEEDSVDDIPAVKEGPTVSRSGDLWCIGKHRLLCADATSPLAYVTLLDGAKAQMVFCDPPYNVKVDGHVSGLGRVKHREFAMAAGEMSERQFINFLKVVFANLAAASVDGAIQYICMDWRHIGEVLAAGKLAYSELKNLCIWTKSNGGMGALYRSQHELIFVFKAGTAQHINNVELGKHGRYRTNVWRYPGINSFGKNRDADLALHPTVKPVAMVADAILDCSKRGGIVLDAFAGSGTTLLAAHRTGRRGYGIELDPAYCDVIVERLTKTAGVAARHAETGLSFDDIARERASPVMPDRPRKAKRNVAAEVS